MSKRNFIIDGNVKMVFGKVSARKYDAWFEYLPKKVQADFDYCTADSTTFIQYRGEWYDIGNFTMLSNPIVYKGIKFIGMYGTSWSTGLLLSVNDDGMYKIVDFYTTSIIE